MERLATLESQGVDSRATQSALSKIEQAMQTGDIDSLKADFNAARQRGIEMGILRASSQGQVQSTQILDNGNLAIVMRDGTVRDTGRRARGFAQRAIDTADGLQTFDPGTGQTTGTISTTEEIAEAEATLKATIESALIDVRRQAELAEQATDQATSFAAYTAARDGLVEALENTLSGPLVGRGPAVTAAQQIAEGAAAAMAPVLKSLFRVSGEGVFTDRDQQLLLDMLPDRTDHPEAQRAKIAAVDAIVAAKLNQAPSTDSTTQATPGGQQVGRFTVEEVQ